MTRQLKLIVGLILLSVVMLPNVVVAQSTQPLTLESVIERYQNQDFSPINQPKTTKKRDIKDKGQRVSKIVVEGNQHIPDALILSEVSIRLGDKLDPFKLDRNVQNIKSLGFFETVDVVVIDEGGEHHVKFTVKENPIVGSIEIDGNVRYTDDEIVERMSHKTGEIFSKSHLRDDIKSIRNLYQDGGILKFKIKDVIAPEKDRDPLRIIIDEGQILNIVITGNTKTQDFVILREMTMKEGDVLTEAGLKEDIRRIYNLNYFTGIEPNLVPTGDGYDLELYITERETNGQFSFGGGYSPQNGFSIFSDLFWDNLFGTGQLILLKGQFGIGGDNSARNTSYQFKYHNPWMWGDRRSFTFKLWNTNGQFRSSPIAGDLVFQDERRFGTEFTFGIPHSYELRTFHKFRFEGIELKDFDRGYHVNSYTFGVVHDTRDVVFNPREGGYESLSIEQAFDVSKTTINFTKYDISLKRFIPTFENQTIALRLDLGLMQSPIIDDEEIFSGEFYRVGFSDTVRSQDDNNFIFGNKKIVTSAEYRFLFNDTFSAVIFVDAGIASSLDLDDWDVAEMILIGKGVGIRFFIPGLGPLRLDAGSDQAGDVRIQVNIGHAF